MLYFSNILINVFFFRKVTLRFVSGFYSFIRCLELSLLRDLFICLFTFRTLRRIFKDSDFFTKGIHKKNDFCYYDKVPMFSKDQIRASLPKVIIRILSVNDEKSRIEYT